MENTGGLVYEGELIHEDSYPRRGEKFREIEIDGIKIDYYDPRNKVIHEIKKSDRHEEAHEWQLKDYLEVLEQNGREDITGVLEYPRLHRTQEVFLTTPDREAISNMTIEIGKIIQNGKCPEKMRKSRCKNCSYFDFCWSGEDMV